LFGSQPALLLGDKNGLTLQNLDSWLTTTSGVRTFNHIADAADYDRDGDLDIVVACFWDFRIYQNSGPAKFTWREDVLPAKFNNNEYSVSGTTFIELNGQYAIVAGAYRHWPGDMKTLPLSVLTQQNGQFVESYTLARPNLGHGRERNYGTSDMFNIDLNGDGREDLLVVWETEPSGGIDDGMSDMSGTPRTARYSDLGNTIFSVYFQDASGKLVADNTFYNGDNTAGAPLFFEDFNLDGYVDFWISSFFARPNNFDRYVFINDGTGHFAHPKTPIFNTNESFADWYTLSPFFFDANNDGAIDVVTTRGVFPNPPTRTIGEEVRTFLSDSPAYNINDNNKLITAIADKTWDGGTGVDTAVFSGKFIDYTFINNNLGIITTTDNVSGRDGQDCFINVERFKFKDCVIGLSDHSLDSDICKIAVSVGAKIIEKHIALDGQKKGLDLAFSLKGKEIRKFKDDIKKTHLLLGKNYFYRTKNETANKKSKRSIYSIDKIEKNEKFSKKNIKLIRPANGLAPEYYLKILGKRSNKLISSGLPIRKEFIKNIK
jgi:hypothetical protein